MSFMRFLAACCFISFIFSSCQKEVSLDTGASITGGSGSGGSGGSGGGTSGDLLVKMVNTSIIDTSTTLFSYDANKKLISQSVKVQGPLSEGDFRRHITRDNAGNVTFVIDSSLQPGGTWEMDTARFYYNGNSIAYALSTDYYGSSSSKDSIAYTYTGSNITKASVYNFISGTYTLDDEYFYTYDAGGNINNYKWYAPGSLTPFQTERKLIYDAKTSPFNWGVEVVLLHSIKGAIDLQDFAFGPNNFTKLEEIDQAGGGNSSTSTFVYTYLSNGKPSKASVSTISAAIPVPFPSTITYFYN